MRKMRELPRFIFIAFVIVASACTSVDKHYVNQVIGEYKLNDADREQLIKTGISKEKIESLQTAYVLKNRRGLIMEYRDTVPMKLELSSKNPNEFFTRDTRVNIDKTPDFKVEFIYRENKQQDRNSSLRAMFSREAVQQLVKKSSIALNLEYHRNEPMASATSSNDPWIRMNENNPQFNISDLEAIASSIRSGDYGDMHSILVIKDGHLLLEEYFNGSNANHVHLLASATKGVTSAIIGIAVDQGLIYENQKIVEIYKNYNIKNISKEKREIAVKDLLTMRHGLSWTQNPFWHYDAGRMIKTEDFVRLWILPRLNAVVVFTAWVPQRGYPNRLNDLLKFKIIPALEELSLPANKEAVSRILSDDEISHIQFNENEPWTGKWRVESNSQGGGIWAMKQEAETVKSTRDSAYEFKGKVRGNQLKGKVVGASGSYDPFTIELLSDSMSFKGTIEMATGRTNHIKGRRIE